MKSMADMADVIYILYRCGNDVHGGQMTDKRIGAIK